MTTDTTVADTILAQLGRSMRQISLMIGAHTFTARPDGVTFRFKARARNGSNCVRITLDPCDTYTVEFLSVRGVKVTEKGKFSDIYNDALTGLFERQTGLYLNM